MVARIRPATAAIKNIRLDEPIIELLNMLHLLLKKFEPCLHFLLASHATLLSNGCASPGMTCSAHSGSVLTDEFNEGKRPSLA